MSTNKLPVNRKPAGNTEYPCGIYIVKVRIEKVVMNLISRSVYTYVTAVTVLPLEKNDRYTLEIHRVCSNINNLVRNIMIARQ